MMNIYNTKLTAIALLFATFFSAQVGINTTNVHPSAILELNSNNKGLLLPRVSLLSTDDTTTIQNPARGLMVYNLNDSPTSVATGKKVFANLIYTFDGNQWNMAMSDDTGVNTINLPMIYARGRKTTNDTGCSGNSGLFNLDSRDYNIEQNGSITANKAGFYKFNISTIMYFSNNQGRNPVVAYSNNTDGNALSFTFRKENGIGYDNFSVSYSGVVYLNVNETSGYFNWGLGGNNVCNSTDRIRQQEVIWEYLGNTLY